jgi:hypothetical protein
LLFSFILKAQKLELFYENKKWGYKSEKNIVIAPEYDTAFIFDKTQQIALVANKNVFNKISNPLTGEEEYAFDYYYINPSNQKITLLAEHFPDSMFTFPPQQELQFNYQDSSQYFKILFQDKLYLFSKNGKQLSTGYDNILVTKASGYYETENISVIDKKNIRVKGLIDSTGLMVVKCKYNEVSINEEDSSVYCCSAVFNSRLNDDVYNYRGKLIYTNNNHIAFSSKTLHVLKIYKPNEHFIIENSLTNDSYEVDGNRFYYLKRYKALVTNNDNWYVLDLKTKKKQRVDQETYFKNLLKIIE